MQSGLQRSLSHDEDAEVRTWSALALARMGDDAGKAGTERALTAGAPEEKVAAAIALGEHGDARGEGELVARWSAAFAPDSKTPGEVDEGRALLTVFTSLKTKAAVPGLIHSLDDLRLRPFIVETLGAIGDPRAKEPLATLFANERYVHLRPLEARALLAVGGGKNELLAPLTRFAGVPEPMFDALEIMRKAKLLVPANGGNEEKASFAKLRLSQSGPARLFVQAAKEPSLRIDHTALPAPSAVPGKPGLWISEPGALEAGDVMVEVWTGAEAVWLVPHAEEIAPPPPQAWDAGTP